MARILPRVMPSGFHFVKEHVEGFGPHEGWRVDNFGVGMVEDAIFACHSAVGFRRSSVNVVHDFAGVEVYDNRTQALRAGVEAEIEVAQWVLLCVQRLKIIP